MYGLARKVGIQNIDIDAAVWFATLASRQSSVTLIMGNVSHSSLS